MFCSNCGSEVNEGAKFCSKCGKQIENVDTESRIVKVYNSTDSKLENDRESKIVFVAIALCLGVVFVLYFLFSNNSKGTSGAVIGDVVTADADTGVAEVYVEETVGEEVDEFIPDYKPGEENEYGVSNANLAAGGYLDDNIMTEQGEYIYYIFENSIYKYKEGGTPVAIIGSTECIHGINVCGDYIYFTEGAYELELENTGSLMRVRTDGTNMELLATGVAGNEIFVIDNDEETLVYYIGMAYNNSSNPLICLSKYNLNTLATEEITYTSANAVHIVGFDRESQILYLDEEYSRNNETYRNIGCCDIKTNQYETLFDEPSGQLGDFFVANDCIVANEFGWMEYVEIIDVLGGNTDLEQRLDQNYRGIVLVDEDKVIFRQSLDICMISIDNMRNVIPVDERINLKDIEGAEVIVSNDNAQKCGVANGWFYYMPDDETICRVKLDGSDWEFFM